MPIRFSVRMQFDASGIVHPEYLRAIGAGIFEPGTDIDHKKPKPWRTGTFTPRNGNTWTLDLATVDDSLAALAAARLIPGRPVRLGSVPGHVLEKPRMVASCRWDQLREAPPIAGVEFRFDSPVHFRSKKRLIAEPEPGLVFYNLHRGWERWSPDTAPEIDFRRVRWSIEVDGETLTTTGPGRYDPSSGIRRAHRIAAFVGSARITFTEASEADRRSLAALTALAPFLGVGADTAAGFGATSITNVWHDE